MLPPAHHLAGHLVTINNTDALPVPQQTADNRFPRAGGACDANDHHIGTLPFPFAPFLFYSPAPESSTTRKAAARAKRL